MRQAAPKILAKTPTLQARRPETVHPIGLADGSQLLVKREERSSIAPSEDEIKHIVNRVVVPRSLMKRLQQKRLVIRITVYQIKRILEELDAFLLGKTPYPYVLPSHIAHFGYEASRSDDRLPIAHKHSERLPRFSALGHRHGGISIQNDH